MTDSEIQRLRAKLEAERALRRGLESVMRRNPDLVARFDREHRHLFVNAAVERAAGKPAEAFLGKTNEELGMPPELCRLWATGLEDVFQSGREQVVEFEFPGPDGARIYQSRIVPERDDDGTVQSVLGITREITDLKQAERAARERAREVEAQHQLVRTITENASAALFMMDPRGHCTYMNPAAERMIGYAFEEIRDRPLHDVIHHTHPDGRPYPMADCPIDRALPEGFRVVDHEDVFIRRDGSYFPVRCSASPIVEHGVRVGTVIEVRDLTLTKRIEAERERLIAELELERSQLRSIFAQAPALIAVVRGPDHVFEIANPAYLEIVGDRPALGRPVRKVFPEIEGQGFLELLDRVYATGEVYVAEEALVLLDTGALDGSRELYLNFVYQPLFDPDGSVSGIFFHGIDVTELVKARKEAQAANRAKSEFLATISHELRTPLHAIVGYADLLLGGVPQALPENARHHVERVLVSARHLNQLIEEVLTFSRLEAGREEVLREPVGVDDLVEEVTAIIEPLAKAKGLDFHVEPPARSLTLETDPRKLRQILLNLASNAVKFTERGHIHIRTRAEGEELCVELSDTGVGIDPADHERIFEPFWQGEVGADAAGGTGLGLSVARRFARMLGGDIEVRSAPDEGTTFEVRLPLVAPDSPDAAGEGEPAGSGSTVAAGSGGTVPARS